MVLSLRRRPPTAFAPVTSAQLPTCPQCSSAMVLRTVRRGETTGERYWGCSRYPKCRGTRPLAAPRPRPSRGRGKTVQQLFEEQRRQVGAGRRGRLAVALASPLTRLPRGTTGGQRVARDKLADTLLAPLWDLGFVGLHDRRAPAGRERIDHLVIGSTGVHVVEMKSWPGQLAVDGDQLYVDGRLREGAADDVLRAAAAVQDALVGELKPLRVSVTPVLCFDRLDMPRFQRRVRGVEVTGWRSLPHAIRSRPEVLTPEQVLAIATAADEILLPSG
jgi:hypothetical protein